MEFSGEINHKYANSKRIARYIGNTLVFVGASTMIAAGGAVGEQYHDAQTQYDTDTENPDSFPDHETAQVALIGMIGYGAMLKGVVLKQSQKYNR